jgi:hypothetical protein
VLVTVAGTMLMPGSAQASAGWGLTGPEKLYEGEADYVTMCKLFPRMAGGGKWIGQPQNRHKFNVNWNGSISASQIDPDDWAVKDLVARKDDLVGGIGFATGMPPIFESQDIGQVDQKLIGGYLPGTSLEWRNDGIAFTQTVFVDLLDPRQAGDPDAMTVACIRVRMRNATSRERPARLWVKLSPAPGDSWSEPCLRDAEGKTRLAVLWDKTIRASFHASYTPPTDAADPRWSRLERDGLLERVLLFEATLRPGEDASVYLKLPYLAQERDHDAALTTQDFEPRLAAWKDRWDKEIGAAALVSTPDGLVNDFYRASVAALILNPDVDPVTGTTYLKAIPGHKYVIAHDVNVAVPALEMIGLGDLAARCLAPFPEWQGLAPVDGQFSSNRGVLMGHPKTEGYFWASKNGWVLHALCDHYWYSLDEAWYEKTLPAILESCDWIIRERKATKVLAENGEPIANYGLLPEGRGSDWVSQQFKETHDSWIGSDAYNYWALECAARLLRQHNHPRSEELSKEAQDYRECLRIAVQRATSKAAPIKYPDGTVLPWVPDELHRTEFPSEAGKERAVREHDAWALWLMYSHVGPLELVPTGVFGADEDTITWALRFMEEYPVNLFFPWVTDPRPILAHGVAFMLPCYNSHTQAFLWRDEIEEYIESYYGFLACGFSRGLFAGVDHTWYLAGQDFAVMAGRAIDMTLRMLVDERGSDLFIARATPRSWLSDGNTMRVERVHTRFGPMSCTIRSHVSTGTVEATIDPPRRNPPADMRLHLRLRHPEGKRISSVLLNGKPWSQFSEDTVTFAAGDCSMARLVVRF